MPVTRAKAKKGSAAVPASPPKAQAAKAKPVTRAMSRKQAPKQKSPEKSEILVESVKPGHTVHTNVEEVPKQIKKKTTRGKKVKPSADDVKMAEEVRVGQLKKFANLLNPENAWHRKVSQTIVGVDLAIKAKTRAAKKLLADTKNNWVDGRVVAVEQTPLFRAMKSAASTQKQKEKRKRQRDEDVKENAHDTAPVKRRLVELQLLSPTDKGTPIGTLALQQKSEPVQDINEILLVTGELEESTSKAQSSGELNKDEINCLEEILDNVDNNHAQNKKSIVIVKENVRDATPEKRQDVELQGTPIKNSLTLQKKSEPVQNVNENLFVAGELEESTSSGESNYYEISCVEETLDEDDNHQQNKNTNVIVKESVCDASPDKTGLVEVQLCSIDKESPIKTSMALQKKSEPVEKINESLSDTVELEESTSEDHSSGESKNYDISCFEETLDLDEETEDNNYQQKKETDDIVKENVRDATPEKRQLVELQWPSNPITNTNSLALQKKLTEPVRDINESLMVAGKIEESISEAHSSYESNNYEISRLEEILDEDNNHRQNKKIPMWARDGALLQGQLFLSNPILLGQVMMDMEFNITDDEDEEDDFKDDNTFDMSFPPCNINYKIFPGAIVPRPRK